VFSNEEKTDYRLYSQQLHQTYANQLRTVLRDHVIFSKLTGKTISLNNNILYEDFVNMTDIILRSSDTVQAISWNPKVNHVDRSNIEKTASQIYNRTLEFKSLFNGTLIVSPYSPFYYPVYYIYPIETNEGAILFNLYSNPVRKTAIDKAVSTGTVSTSDSIRLVQGGPGVIAFVPVYSSQNQQPLGIVSLVFNLEILVLTAFQSLERVAGLEINISNDRVNETLLSITFNNTSLTINKDQTYNPPTNSSLYATLADVVWRIDMNVPHPNELQSSEVILIMVLTLLGIICIAFVIGYIGFRKIMFQEKYLAGLEKKNEYISSMINYVNHEIRNPLNSAIGMIEIAKTELIENAYLSTDDLVLSNLTASYNSCILMKHIVDDVLDIKKLEDGKLDLFITDIDMNEFTIGITKLLSNQMQEHPNIEFNISNEVTDMRSDSYRITQILLNMITNSYKFTDWGSIYLIITNEPDDFVKFQVVDTGKGVKDQDLLFEPFVRSINNNIISRQVGSGLGLYLCKMLTDLLDGTIGFSNNPNSPTGTGSIFWFRIPRYTKNIF